MSFYVSTATFVLLYCDEWDRVVALPRHKFVTGATLLQVMLYQCQAIYFLKAEYIIQVMNSAVKDKWGVGSSLNFSPIKIPIQYKRKPLNIY